MWCKRIKKDDFDLICRLCLRKIIFSKVSIFPSTNERESVAKLIKYALNMKVSQNDQLPHIICTICMDKLLEYTKFRRKCLMSNERLRQILNENQFNKKIIENVQAENLIDLNFCENQNDNEIQETEIWENVVPDNADNDSTEVKNEQESLIQNSEKISIDCDDFRKLPILELLHEHEENEERKQEQKNYEFEYVTVDLKDQLEEQEEELEHYLENENDNFDKNDVELNEDQEEDIPIIDGFFVIEIQDDDDDTKNDDKIEDNIQNLMNNFEVDSNGNVKKQKRNTKKLGSSSKIKNERNDYRKMKEKEEEKQCQICGKIYRKLDYHMLVHKGIKNYKCTVCSRAFTMSCTLKEHMKIHTNDRSFKCSHCEKGFNSRQSLKAHELHHTKEMNYECEICKRKFVYNSTLQYHKKTHTQIRKHKCDICSREFITKHALKKHYRIHTGEKPYECKECGKKFAQGSGLSIHKKTHTKQISIRCDLCGIGFHYKSIYKNHMKNHHQEIDIK